MKVIIVSIVMMLFAFDLPANVVKGKPDVIVCSLSASASTDNWDTFVFYISGVRKDGSILYKSMTSNPVLVTVDRSGKVSAPNLKDCDQQNVSALKKNGQAYNFK
ncbi:MAG: hypothetical protein V2I33_08055 [Kangiellaceae bacterium]|jgi:hypothetical protein|nr:hypothetical protein [Kangiellaceae bacterium]